MTNNANATGAAPMTNRTMSKGLGERECLIPRKRKLASSRSKLGSDEDGVRFGYFSPPEDISDGSDHGKESDADDVGVEIITKAEFKNADGPSKSKAEKGVMFSKPAASKKERFSDVVKDVSSDDLSDSETSSADSFPDDILFSKTVSNKGPKERYSDVVKDVSSDDLSGSSSSGDDYQVELESSIVEVSISGSSDEQQGSDSETPTEGKKRKKKADSPSPSNHDSDSSHDDDDDVEKVGETKKRTSRQVSPQDYDFCRMLADSMLGREQVHETNIIDKVETQTQTVLPLKFGFEEEVLKKAEKTEAEMEIEDSFTLMAFCSTSQDDVGAFTRREVDPEVQNSNAEETTWERCARGKHELILHDDQGIVCGYCHHVEIGPKDVMPQWAVRTGRKYEQRRSTEPEQHREFDEIHLKPSNDNVEDSSCVANGTVWSIKPSIQKSMYQHQQEGFEFLWKNLAGSINLDELKSTVPSPSEVGGCIISHAPGTGKTLLTLVFIETYMKVFPNCLPVIIAPAGMLLTWAEEFKKWNVDVPFLNLNNADILDKKKKAMLGNLTSVGRRNKKMIRMINLYSWSIGRTVLGISYCLFEKLSGEKFLKKKKCSLSSRAKDLRQILLEKPGLVILDEGHTPRNQRSNIWNALLKLHTKKRVILSGTPFQNNFSELFNTLRIVRPAIADSLAQEKPLAEMLTARRKYKATNPDSDLLSEVNESSVEKLKIAMLPFVHVHKGTILQQNLPGLRDCVVLLNPPALQKSLIERLEGTPSTFKLEHKSALLSVHPYLLKHSKITDKEKFGIDLAGVEASKLNPNEGVKTKFIVEFIRLCMAMNEKVLVFSQYIHPLHLIKEQLKEIFQWTDDGNQILLMKGSLDQKQRQILINLFNVPHNMSRVMLASTKCCSEGISLVGASRVILLDVVWNPSVERQAISRAYRIGQEKFVYTYHLMTLGTTEADKYCRQAEKERLSELVFTSSSNEASKLKVPCGGIEDRILEVMVDHSSLKDMFVKIINQPKDNKLIQSFGINP